MDGQIRELRSLIWQIEELYKNSAQLESLSGLVRSYHMYPEKWVSMALGKFFRMHEIDERCMGDDTYRCIDELDQKRRKIQQKARALQEKGIQLKKNIRFSSLSTNEEKQVWHEAREKLESSQFSQDWYTTVLKSIWIEHDNIYQEFKEVILKQQKEDEERRKKWEEEKREKEIAEFNMYLRIGGAILLVLIVLLLIWIF